MSMSKYNSFVNAFWLVANVAAVVGIITANKLVFGHFKFHFGTLLTVIHFACTSLCLEIGKTFGWIERKSDVSWMKVLPLSMAFCGFVVLTNLSLQYNSVGFYQVSFLEGNLRNISYYEDGKSNDNSNYGLVTIRNLWEKIYTWNFGHFGCRLCWCLFGHCHRIHFNFGRIFYRSCCLFRHCHLLNCKNKIIILLIGFFIFSGSKQNNSDWDSMPCSYYLTKHLYLQ